MGALHQRAVRQVALNGEAGRTYSFSALSSNSSGSRPFMPRDAGANPVKATISLRKRRFSIRDRETLCPLGSL